ncbi:hypothetical protein LOK49_LG08G03347 [Camellia lanceoleosa]|uniref:Uncharacterized protein n=1 Tax=Camellia lanceoleosa TaxID=1840588 RepID=A0ACC0GV19_9ERIC|nr:hypothetical protein LOK49_LG08G03347 [Camellia lanceoleosa]
MKGGDEEEDWLDWQKSFLFFLFEETVDESMASGIDLLTVSLYQMDLGRTLFSFEIISSYSSAEALEAITPSSQMELIQEWWPITKSLKGSRKKIEKYMVHIHKTTELWNRLSKQEQKFAKRCIEDLEDHFEKSVLSKLPD